MKHESFLKEFNLAHGALHVYLLAAVRDSHEADDLLQEVSLVLWSKFDQYDPSRSFTAWAIGIAKYKVLHSRRSAATTNMLSSSVLEALADETTDLQGGHSPQDHLAECLSRLSEPLRQILNLKYWERRSIAQIAQSLTRSSQSVAMMLVRARQSIRQCIQQRVDQESA